MHGGGGGGGGHVGGGHTGGGHHGHHGHPGGGLDSGLVGQPRGGRRMSPLAGRIVMLVGAVALLAAAFWH